MRARVRGRLAEALLSIGDHQGVIRLYREEPRALAAADAARVTEHLSLAYLQLNQVEAARAQVQNLLNQVEASGDPHGWARGLAAAAYVSYRLGEARRAIALGYRALRLLECWGTASEVARAHHRLGFFHWDLGEYGTALAHLEEATARQRAAEDHRALCATLSDLGEVYQDIFCLGRAVALHREGLRLALTIGDDLLAVDHWRNLGMDFLYQGRTSKAMDTLQRARRLAEAIDAPPYLLEQCLRALMEAFLRQGQADQAEGLLPRYRELTGPREAAFPLIFQAGVALVRDDREEAERLLGEVWGRLDRERRHARTFHVALFVGQRLVASGMTEQGKQYLSWALEQLDSIAGTLTPQVRDELRASRLYRAAEAAVGALQGLGADQVPVSFP